MSSEKLNIIEKSYKLLFVLYAPVAIIGYIINAIGGFNMSFLSISLLSISTLSIVITIVLVIGYIKKRKIIVNMADVNQNAPYLYRHDFLIPFIFISVLSFSTICFLTYKGATTVITPNQSTTVFSASAKPKIVLMLGLTNANDLDKSPAIQEFLIDYGASEIQGLSHYRRFSPNHGNDYELKIIDHERKYTPELEEKIKSALNNGTKYFICTTSPVSVPLSRKFEQLILETNSAENNPILLCTNTGSPEVETKTNMVYRFYVRSNEEAKVLAKKGKNLNFNKIAYIAINNEYGKGAVASFEKEWRKHGLVITNGIFIDPALSESSIINKIQKSNLLQQKPDALFIANNDKSLMATIRGIQNYPNDIAILATSGLSVKYTQVTIRHILKNKRWFTCVPESKARGEILDFDLPASFIAIVLEKFTSAIDNVNKNPETTFHNELTQQEIPLILNFKYDKKGDFNIDLRIDSVLVGSNEQL